MNQFTLNNWIKGIARLFLINPPPANKLQLIQSTVEVFQALQGLCMTAVGRNSKFEWFGISKI